jgi:hypothetical protein
VELHKVECLKYLQHFHVKLPMRFFGRRTILLLLVWCFAICPTNVFLSQFICLHAQMSFDSWLWNWESNQWDCLLEHRSCNRNLTVNIEWFKIIVDKSGSYVRGFMWQLCGWVRVDISLTVHSRAILKVVKSMCNGI